MSTDTVATPSVLYDEMFDAWELIQDLLGGTRAMRAAGQKWLPKEDIEKDTAWLNRLKRSILYEGYKSTVNKLAGRPFSKVVTVHNAPPQLEYLETNVDRTGQSLTAFTKEAFTDAINYGITHFLVDFTRMPQNEEGQIASIADEKEIGARCSFITARATEVIGWRTETLNGEPRLTELRIRKSVVEPSEGKSYEDEVVHYVWVWTPTTWEKHRKNDDDSWAVVASGSHTFGSIPLATMYTNRTGFMTAVPPLEGLAWLNLAHWQSDSDQRHILRYSRFAILFASGLSSQENEDSFKIGPTNMFSSENADADLKFVEHKGTAIEAGRKDLEDLESRMEKMGLQPYARQTQKSTATGKKIDEGNNLSQMEMWVRQAESMLTTAYEMAAKWHKIELPEDFSIDIFTDFDINLYGDKDMDWLLKAVQAGKITLETFLKEIERRGKFGEGFDLEAEITELKEVDKGLADLLIGTEDDTDIDDGDEGQDSETDEVS